MLVPKIAPIAAPPADTNNALPAEGTFPFSSTKPAFDATPSKTPILSNKSTNKKLIIAKTTPITTTGAPVNIPSIESFPNVGAIAVIGLSNTSNLSGNCA